MTFEPPSSSEIIHLVGIGDVGDAVSGVDRVRL
jgi:hypothetical protein